MQCNYDGYISTIAGYMKVLAQPVSRDSSAVSEREVWHDRHSAVDLDVDL